MPTTSSARCASSASPPAPTRNRGATWCRSAMRRLRSSVLMCGADVTHALSRARRIDHSVYHFEPVPDLRPFRGLRYDLARVADLSAVLCPPYDVISPTERDELLVRDPANAVRL